MSPAEAVDDYLHISPNVLVGIREFEDMQRDAAVLEGTEGTRRGFIRAHILEDLGNQTASTHGRQAVRYYADARASFAACVENGIRADEALLHIAHLDARLQLKAGADPRLVLGSLYKSVMGLLTDAHRQFEANKQPRAIKHLSGRRTELLADAFLAKTAYVMHSKGAGDPNTAILLPMPVPLRCDQNEQDNFFARRSGGHARSSDFAVHFLSHKGNELHTAPVPLQVKTPFDERDEEDYDLDYLVLIGGSSHMGFSNDDGTDVVQNMLKTEPRTRAETLALALARINIENDIGRFLKEREGSKVSNLGKLAILLAQTRRL